MQKKHLKDIPSVTKRKYGPASPMLCKKFLFYFYIVHVGTGVLLQLVLYKKKLFSIDYSDPRMLYGLP